MSAIENCLLKCRLYNFNSRKGIKYLLNIPDHINIDDLRNSLSSCYTFFYLRKPLKKENKETREERHKRFLSIDEPLDIYDTRPDDYTRDTYRMLININEKWLKKTLKTINKLLSASLIEKHGKEINYPIPYLHSSLKKRSYTTNVKMHKENSYLLTVDIQNFYPSISYEKIFNFFKYDLKLNNDIATIYSIICTCPLDDPITKNYSYGIGQGLATSPVLSFLVNYRMFEYINKLAVKKQIEMTVYVDDIVFSSSRPIQQEFINSLFGIVKRNNLSIKKSKVKIYGPNKCKKITGLCITTGGKIRVPKSKHEEVKIQFDYLSKEIVNIKNINDYFSIYNLFIKFKGNIEFIKLVEEYITSKHTAFVNEYKDFFPYGVKKKIKNKPYSKGNVEEIDYKNFLLKYENLKKYIDSK